MAAHAKYFGASAGHRWLHCAQAPEREKGKPNTSSGDSRLGTAAHFLGATCLIDRSRPSEFLGRQIAVWENRDQKTKGECFAEQFQESEGTTVHFIEVTDDMVQHITAYVDFVLHLVETTGGELFVETRVDYREWLPDEIDEDDGFGTADVIIVVPGGVVVIDGAPVVVKDGEIIVVDLKYGQGEKVDAKDNDQERLYGLGAYARHALLNDFKSLRNIIVQPRKGGVSEWSYPIEEVLAWGEWVKQRAQVVLDGSEPANPGSKQCRWCKAKGTTNPDGSWTCPESAAEVLTAIFGDFDDLTVAEPRTLSLPELPVVWEKLDVIEGFCRAVKERMYESTLAGEVADYKIVEGRKGNRTWKNAAEAEAALKALRLKQDQMYKMALESPAAIEKVLKDKPRSWKKVANLITQPGGKLTVAHISDPRKAIPKIEDSFENLDAPAVADADLF